MMRILVVDDNEAFTTILKDLLEKEGPYRVATAENGEDGYLAFLHFKPDIILTDIDMPVKNGIEMMREIRAHYPRVKTVYMSGDLSRYEGLLERERLEYNANLINKPFLFSKVIHIFNEYEQERRAA